MLFASVAVALFTILPAGSAIGYALGRRGRARADDSGKTQLAAWEATLLALSGLLIGFTFSMAQTRYDARKEIVLAEANHIGTTYLRTRLVEPARGEELRALLRRYVDLRLAFADAGGDRARVAELARQSSTLGEQIWSRVAAAGQADRSPVTALLVASTNDMLDASEAHQAALENPMPRTVFLVLILVTTAAMTAVGYRCGVEGRVRVVGMIVMPLLLATVILLVFDLAHPRIGIVKVHDPTLARLKQSF